MIPQKEETKTPEEEELTKYELMTILVPDLAKEENEKELKKIRKLITDHKGEIYHEDDWDVRNLAYVIKKQDRGYYVIFYFTFPPENLKELEKEFLLNQKMLRHMIVKSPKGYTIKKLSELEAPKKVKKKEVVEVVKEEKPVVEVKEEVEEKEEEKPAEEVKEEVAVKKEEEKVEEKEEKPVEKEEAPKEEKPVEEKKEEEKPEEEKPAEKEEEAKEEVKKEEEPKKKPMDISDLDSKLESILEDPDINIKL